MEPVNSLKHLFLLDKTLTFLNFGSYGSCPKPVFDDYQNWQRMLEREPVQFIAVNGPGYMKKSREALAGYIGCDADDVVYTPNPTFAFNIVAKNLELKPGDEILATNLEYGAMDRTWNYYCNKAGAKFVRREIPFPVTTHDEFVDYFLKGITPSTKAVFISQITSATALILPAKEICSRAKQIGLITIVDGAHVPGHIPLNLSEWNVDFYTGACHKWMMTPKGSSFLYAHKSVRDQLDPLVISWGYESDNPSGSRFHDYHEFNGTRDFSAYLSIPAAIEFMNQNNWDMVKSDCRKIVIENAARFCELSGEPPICPLSSEWLGQMFSIPVKLEYPSAFQRMLFEKYRIEIPVTRTDDRNFIRYSINAFNDQSDLDRLYDALASEWGG
jgi:isopenicillin-N epimerase